LNESTSAESTPTLKDISRREEKMRRVNVGAGFLKQAPCFLFNFFLGLPFGIHCTVDPDNVDSLEMPQLIEQQGLMLLVFAVARELRDRYREVSGYTVQNNGELSGTDLAEVLNSNPRNTQARLTRAGFAPSMLYPMISIRIVSSGSMRDSQSCCIEELIDVPRHPVRGTPAPSSTSNHKPIDRKAPNKGCEGPAACHGRIPLKTSVRLGQLAKMAGARAVGIAGGPEKCRYVSDELQFDAAVDHRASDFVDQLAAACPKGIDVYFENVGGAVWQAVLPLLNSFARVPVCGLIAQYSATGQPAEPNLLPATMREPHTARLHQLRIRRGALCHIPANRCGRHRRWTHPLS
jgi:hypothetical protein